MVFSKTLQSTDLFFGFISSFGIGFQFFRTISQPVVIKNLAYRIFTKTDLNRLEIEPACGSLILQISALYELYLIAADRKAYF